MVANYATCAAHIHLTINLTPSLLWQLEDYLEHGATGRSLELTLKLAESLDSSEREMVLGTFFDVNWHNQIFSHPPRFAYPEDPALATVDVFDLAMLFGGRTGLAPGPDEEAGVFNGCQPGDHSAGR